MHYLCVCLLVVILGNLAREQAVNVHEFSLCEQVLYQLSYNRREHDLKQAEKQFSSIQLVSYVLHE
jgi:hypothetical protein